MMLKNKQERESASLRLRRVRQWRVWTLIGCVILFLMQECAADSPKIPVPVSELGEKYELFSRLHIPLGHEAFIDGRIVDVSSKTAEAGTNLQIFRIRGEATQENIRVHVLPYHAWGDVFPGTNVKLATIQNGKWYHMKGYITGQYVGIPRKAYEHAGYLVQSPAFTFVEQFVAYEAREIAPIRHTPADFAYRWAMFSGIAAERAGKAIVQGDGWTANIEGFRAWEPGVVGKEIEASGMYCPLDNKNEYLLCDAKWRLLKLGDQVGSEVTLKGIARGAHNGAWWLAHKDGNVYIQDARMASGWSHRLYGTAVEVKGRLDRVVLPAFDNLTEASKKVVPEFVIRNPTWKRLDKPLLYPEIPASER